MLSRYSFSSSEAVDRLVEKIEGHSFSSHNDVDFCRPILDASRIEGSRAHADSCFLYSLDVRRNLLCERRRYGRADF